MTRVQLNPQQSRTNWVWSGRGEEGQIVSPVAQKQAGPEAATYCNMSSWNFRLIAFILTVQLFYKCVNTLW